MSNEDTYSADFKAKVAAEAIKQDKKNLEQLSKKFDVPVSTILTWAVKFEKNPESAFSDEADIGEQEQDTFADEEIDVEITDVEIADSFEHGVMADKLNLRRITFWAVFAIILFLIFVQGVKELYQYGYNASVDKASGDTEFYQVNQQKKKATETLNSFGVVDLQNGIYRIPIDSAINEIVEESQ